jgi:hypothetical protein
LAAKDMVGRSLVVLGVGCTNMHLRSAQVMKDVVSGDLSSSKKSGDELVAEMRVCN